MNTINVKIIQRTDTSENWDLHNPILDNGEIGYDIDKKTFKIGNGSSTWTSLPYYNEIIDGGDYIPVKSPAMLAKSDTWYKGSVARSTITSINIVDSADDATIATADESWAAGGDFNKDGENDDSVMCYVNGTELTIAGDGSGKIYMNPDSSMVFSSSVDSFSSLIKINGLEILDSSKATTLYRMFRNCYEIRDISLGNFNVENVKNIGGLFANCKKLESITGLDSWNTKNLEDMSMIFAYCDALTTIDDVSNWNTKNVNTMYCTFMAIPNIESLNLTKWDTSKVTTMAYMFGGDEKLTTIGDTTNWDTSNVTDMQTMFQDCSKLKSLNTTNWNTANVIDMKYMFNRCNELTTIGDTTNWNTSNVTDMYAMFQYCNSIDNLNTSNWDTSKVTAMQFMFNECLELSNLDTSNWDTSNVTSMTAMFQSDGKLAFLDVGNWNTSKVTDMSYMFNFGDERGILTNLDVSGWDTSNVIDLEFMFYGANKLGTLDVRNWNTSKVKSFDHMFAHSRMVLEGGEEALKNWRTDSATNMYGMFHSIQNTVLDVSKFNTSKVTIFGEMFEQCNKLTTIIGLENFDTSKGIGFRDMFNKCYELKELNLSSFDTSKATYGVKVSNNGEQSDSTHWMFNECRKLQKVILGSKFDFNGDGTTKSGYSPAIFPTQNSTYITGADGYWYTEDGTAYTPEEIQAMDNSAGTYYASINLIPS